MNDDTRKTIKKAYSSASGIEAIFSICAVLSIIGGIILMVFGIINKTIGTNIGTAIGLIFGGLLTIFFGRGIASALECLAIIAKNSAIKNGRKQRDDYYNDED